MNNSNRDSRRNKSQRHRKYCLQNHRRKFSNFNNEVPINIKEVHRTPNILDQKNRNGEDKVKKNVSRLPRIIHVFTTETLYPAK